MGTFPENKITNVYKHPSAGSGGGRGGRKNLEIFISGNQTTPMISLEHSFSAVFKGYQ